MGGRKKVEVLSEKALVGFRGGETGIGKSRCGDLVREQKREESIQNRGVLIGSG